MALLLQPGSDYSQVRLLRIIWWTGCTRSDKCKLCCMLVRVMYI